MKTSPRCSRLRFKPSASRRVRPSKARSSAIGADVAFVNVGGKGEALIEIAELKDAEGVLEVEVGDRIQAMVVSTEGGLTLSRRLARGAATNAQLEDAFYAGLPVEGKIESDVKGGYQVRIGGQRAFCPFSQIDTVRTTDPAQHVGRVYAFRIIEYKEGGRNVIVSRRALLEEEQRASAVEVRRSIAVGAVLTGRVTSVRDFGAFVDLGAGVQGLLHVSEMAWSRVSDASQIVTPGEEITVKVLRIDEDAPEDRPRVEAAQRRSVVNGAGDLRDRPGAHRPRRRASRSSGRSSSSSRGSKGWRAHLQRLRRRDIRRGGLNRSPRERRRHGSAEHGW